MSFWERKTWDPRTGRPQIDGLTIASHVQPRDPLTGTLGTLADIAAAEFLNDRLFLEFMATLDDILNLPETPER